MVNEPSKNAVGLGTEITEEHTEFLMDGGKRGVEFSVTIDSTARDATGSPAHTPTTKLQKGLVMGRITATNKWKEYDDADSDGTEVARGILTHEVNLLDADATAQEAQAVLHIAGWYDEDNLLGLDTNGKVDLKALHCLFKEDVLPTA
jgi:hypothetical protein